MRFYTCEACQAICGSWRLHCAVCGTIPAQYSMTSKPEPSIACAQHCDRAESHRASRINLRTVTLDYYAGE